MSINLRFFCDKLPKVPTMNIFPKCLSIRHGYSYYQIINLTNFEFVANYSKLN